MRKGMNLSNTLSLVGVVLALPGVLLLIFSDQMTIAVLVLLLAALVIGGALGWRWHINQPAVTLLKAEKTLSFEDEQAHVSVVDYRLRIRAYHKGLQLFRLANVSTDGSVGEIWIDGQRTTLSRISAGQGEVSKEFSGPLDRGQERDIRLWIQFFDSFDGPTQRWTHVVGHKTKRVSLKAQFHSERPCKSVRAYLRYGGQVHRNLNEKVRVSEDRCEVTLELRRVRLGEEYTIEWDW